MKSSTRYYSDKKDYFSEAEYACRCGCGLGKDDMKRGFKTRMNILRHRCGFPLAMTSAVRCLKHTHEVSTVGDNSPHNVERYDNTVEGVRAADLQVPNHRVHAVIKHAMDLKFSIGIRKDGRGKYMIHLDDAHDKLTFFAYR